MANAWRIVKTKYKAQAFDGEGARLYGGRWSSAGQRAIYTSGTIALATLEMLVHLPTSAILSSYSLFQVDIPDSLIEVLDPGVLPRDWRKSPAPTKLQTIGDAWLAGGKSVALKVPSAIVPLESNYVINPAHPAFKKLKIGAPLPYPFDPRLT